MTDAIRPRLGRTAARLLPKLIARDMHGGRCIAREYHVMRYPTNSRTVNTDGRAPDADALILGRAVAGLAVLQAGGR